jgi:ubiquinone/menaquinone biosynthesis C-methylase UbiE
VAVKYFADIGIIGGICLGLAGICWWLIGGIAGIVVSWGLLIFGAACLWIAFNYVPLYLMMMRQNAPTNHWKTVLVEAGVQGDFTVLDVGCGTGRAAIEVARSFPQAQVVGIDIFHGASGNSPEQAQRNAEIEGVGNRVEIKEGNLLQNLYPDGTFDVVTSSSVLHDVHGNTDKEKAVREIERVLKPGGILVALEIFQDWRMWASLLFFAKVWSPDTYWRKLLSGGELQLVIEKRYTRFLHYGVFVAKKRNAST